MSSIDFYFDIVCPYAYMASTRIGQLAAEAGVSVRWRPILLGGVLREVGSADVPAETYSTPRRRMGELDILRQAERFGLDFAIPEGHPRRTVEAMRLLVSAPQQVVPELARSLYQAYWDEDRDISDRGVLRPIAEAHGVDLAVLDDAAIKQRLHDETAAAVARGVFGVPTFGVGDRLFWGADRLHFVRRALGVDREQAPPAKNTDGSRVVFFHDFASPFSYLASTQIKRICEETGAQLEWCPILLGGLFRAIGTPDVPMQAMNPARQQYTVRDMADWAQWWGVDLKFPSRFPLRTVAALRVALQEPRATAPLYRAAWADDLDISEPDVLAEVLEDAGLDAEGLMRGTHDVAVKQRLKENTARAKAVGACGVPTFHIDDRVLIWGQDRLDQVRAAIGGWQPRADSAQNGSLSSAP